MVRDDLLGAQVEELFTASNRHRKENDAISSLKKRRSSSVKIKERDRLSRGLAGNHRHCCALDS